MYVTPSSPELNRTENFCSWFNKMKKVCFQKMETMTSKICDICDDTHPSELYAFMDQSKHQFTICETTLKSGCYLLVPTEFLFACAVPAFLKSFSFKPISSTIKDYLTYIFTSVCIHVSD